MILLFLVKVFQNFVTTYEKENNLVITNLIDDEKNIEDQIRRVLGRNGV